MNVASGASSTISWYNTSNFDFPFLFAVSIIEWNTANSSAPSCVLNPPDTLAFTFSILMAASLALYQHLDNASERGIRKVKIKMKNSGTFRSDAGANAFLDLLSIVETTKKHNNSPTLLSALYSKHGQLLYGNRSYITNL